MSVNPIAHQRFAFSRSFGYTWMELRCLHHPQRYRRDGVLRVWDPQHRYRRAAAPHRSGRTSSHSPCLAAVAGAPGPAPVDGSASTAITIIPGEHARTQLPSTAPVSSVPVDCPKCTFHNPAGRSRCAMCDNKLPVPATAGPGRTC